MGIRLKCSDIIWGEESPWRTIMVIMLLLTVSIIAVGVRLHSSIVWAILFGMCIVCLAFSGIMSYRKKKLAPRENVATIRTITENNDNFLHMMYPETFEESINENAYAQRDSPPSYNAVISVPPPSYSEAIKPPDYTTAITKLNKTEQTILRLDMPLDTTTVNSSC